MERCFIIEQSAKLYKDYFDFVALQQKNNAIIKKFVAENVTERINFNYRVGSKAFSMILTDAEYDKFQSQLRMNCEHTECGDLYTFKQRSPIGKLYAALNITAAHKPPLIWYLAINTGRFRLFDYDNVLYATIEGDEVTPKMNVPFGWTEICKSVFYGVLEQIEREEAESNKNNTGIAIMN